VAIEILGMIVAGAGAGWGWWQLQRRRDRVLGLRELENAMDPDAAAVFAVATHAMTSRGHDQLWALHLLYGLLQDDGFREQITSTGGAPEAIESRVLAELDTRSVDSKGAEDALRVINHAYFAASQAERPITVRDLAAHVLRTQVAELVAGVDPYELVFSLVHGMQPPELERGGARTHVHVILRNDDFTTQELVTEILRDVFGLPDDEAYTRMMQTHTEGKTIVGRYPLAIARDKVITARSRARAQVAPLWIGLEDC
jgi:ATP-dependent Clp protease adapter protein ClpS